MALEYTEEKLNSLDKETNVFHHSTHSTKIYSTTAHELA